MAKIDSLLPHTVRSFDSEKCIQFQTLKFLKWKYLSGYIFWKVLNVDSLLPHTFCFLWLKKVYWTSNTETFWHGSSCRVTFFEKWQNLLVFYHIYFVPLVGKSIFNFKHWIFDREIFTWISLFLKGGKNW